MIILKMTMVITIVTMILINYDDGDDYVNDYDYFNNHDYDDLDNLHENENEYCK